MRLPTYAEHRRFCEVEGWEDKDKAAGRPRRDHHRYVLTLATGAQLYTRVSHGRGSYGDESLWGHILRDQLQVSAEEFWACVGEGKLPPRPPAGLPPPGNAIPAALAWQLIHKAGVAESRVQSMTKDEAVAAWNRFLSG